MFSDNGKIVAFCSLHQLFSYPVSFLGPESALLCFIVVGFCRLTLVRLMFSDWYVILNENLCKCVCFFFLLSSGFSPLQDVSHVVVTLNILLLCCCCCLSVLLQLLLSHFSPWVLYQIGPVFQCSPLLGDPWHEHTLTVSPQSWRKEALTSWTWWDSKLWDHFPLKRIVLRPSGWLDG